MHTEYDVDGTPRTLVTVDGYLKRCKWAAILATIFASAISALAMSIAWRHNPQGELYGEGGIDWGHLLLIGVSWFLPIWIVGFIATYVFGLFLGWLRR
jgi:hypothetical protein